MMRSGAFARKAPTDAPVEPADDAGSSATGDTVTCPNCKCEFNPETDEVVNAPTGEQPTGADLDVPAPPTNPGPPMGTEAMAALMASLH